MNQITHEILEVCQVRPSGFVIYNKYLNRRPGFKNSNKSLLVNLKEKPTYSGTVTKHAKKRIARAVSLLLAISPWQTVVKPSTGEKFKMKINFLTLTLPAAQGLITDQEIKKQCLEPFLLAMRRKWGVKSYIWRAERQKNGNLHFHITTNVFIPYDELRDIWNEKLNKLGFIDRYEQKHGNRHPNSTDIHSVRNISNIEAYLVKYMCKEADQKDIVTGKIWDCSRNLKIKDNCELLIDNEVDSCIQDSIADEQTELLHFDHCTFVNLPARRFYKYVRGSVKTAYDDWIKLIRNLPDN